MFTTYAHAFSTLDAEAVLDVFADCCIAAAPQFVGCTKSQEELRSAVTQLYEFYANIGLEAAKLVTLTETPLDDHYSLVKVEWATYFRQLGNEPLTFEVTYIIQTSAETPKIILFISHGDEQAVMRENGLLPS